MIGVEPEFIDFVKRLVVGAGEGSDRKVILPEERMTIQEAVQHPFITKRGELPPVDISVTCPPGEEKTSV